MNIELQLANIARRKEELEEQRNFLVDARKTFSRDRIQNIKKRNEKWMQEMEIDVAKHRCPISESLITELEKMKLTLIPRT